MVDDPGDGHLGGMTALGVGDGDDRYPVGDPPVQVGQLVVERAVDGGHDLEVLVALGVEGAHHGVVMDDVEVRHRVVGIHDVAHLRDAHANSVSFSLFQRPSGPDRRRRIAGGIQEYVVAGGLVATGQLVDDQLDAAVQLRRDRGPRGSDDSNAHYAIEPCPEQFPDRTRGLPPTLTFAGEVAQERSGLA